MNVNIDVNIFLSYSLNISFILFLYFFLIHRCFSSLCTVYPAKIVHISARWDE